MQRSFSTLAIGGIFALLAFGLYAGIFFKVRAYSQEASGYRNDLEMEQIRETELQTAKILVEETAIDREDLKTHIIPADQPVAAIELVEGLAAMAGLSFSIDAVESGENPVDGTDPKITEIITLRISARGSWYATYRFLSLMENLPYRVVWQNLTVEEDSGAWKTSAVVGLVKYK